MRWWLKTIANVVLMAGVLSTLVLCVVFAVASVAGLAELNP